MWKYAWKKVWIDQKGYTLVEVIVVLIIIAILAAIALPSLTGYIDEANQVKSKVDERNMKIAALLQQEGGSENAPVVPRTYYDDIKEATIKALEKNPRLKDLGSGSDRNKKVAAAIAEMMGEELITWEGYQLYKVSGVEVESASNWNISVNDSGIYISASHVLKDAGEQIAKSLGVERLATPSEVAEDASLKNENVFWSSAHLATGGHNGKPSGHLSILLYKY